MLDVGKYLIMSIVPCTLWSVRWLRNTQCYFSWCGVRGKARFRSSKQKDIVDDVWDAPGVAGITAPPWFTSPTIALTWKVILSESVVLSVKLTLHVKVFSNSLVSSSGIKPTGLSATRVSADFLTSRWAWRPKRMKSVSPVSSPASMDSLNLES